MCRVREDTTIASVDAQIYFLQDRLTDKHLVTQDQCFVSRAPAHYLDTHRFGHIDFLKTTVSILGDLFVETPKPQLLDDK